MEWEDIYAQAETNYQRAPTGNSTSLLSDAFVPPHSKEEQGKSQVTLPPLSKKGWYWKRDNGDEPVRHIYKSLTPQEGTQIEILVEIDKDSNTAILRPVLPAFTDDQAVEWTDPEKLSAMFAKASETLEAINPSKCLNTVTQAREHPDSESYSWWHARVLNTVLRDSDESVAGSDHGFTVGTTRYRLRFGKATAHSENAPINFYYKERGDILSNPRKGSVFLPHLQGKDILTASRAVDHNGIRAIGDEETV